MTSRKPCEPSQRGPSTASFIPKYVRTGLAALSIFGGPAFAADMPVKAPPPPAVYSWTGFYAGGNLGYGWGDAPTGIAGSATTVALPGVGGFPGNNVAFADSNTALPSGVIGGGQIGYNYQFSPKWVLGFEADIQGSGERGSNTFADPFSTTVCAIAAGPPPACLAPPGTLNATAATAYDANISWFGTVRGRLGFLIGDQTLLYGTGGLAYGRVGVSGITNVTGTEITGGTPATLPVTPAASAFSESRINAGLAIGGGIESRFSSFFPAGWTWKVEYLYVDLGTLDTAAPFPGAFVPIPGSPFLATTPFAGTIATQTRFTDNIVRVGLNYKFGN
jgi:outer membrane immunogenic protein